LIVDPDPAGDARDGDRQVRCDDHHERNEQKVETEVETREDAYLAGGEQARHVVPALVMALRPPGSLAEPRTERANALLRHGRRATEADLPAQPREIQSKVEVLGQAVRPWRPAQGAQRRQPGELTVAAESDGSNSIATGLGEVA